MCFSCCCTECLYWCWRFWYLYHLLLYREPCLFLFVCSCWWLWILVQNCAGKSGYFGRFSSNTPSAALIAPKSLSAICGVGALLWVYCSSLYCYQQCFPFENSWRSENRSWQHSISYLTTGNQSTVGQAIATSVSGNIREIRLDFHCQWTMDWKNGPRLLIMTDYWTFVPRQTSSAKQLGKQ